MFKFSTGNVIVTPSDVGFACGRALRCVVGRVATPLTYSIAIFILSSRGTELPTECAFLLETGPHTASCDPALGRVEGAGRSQIRASIP